MLFRLNQRKKERKKRNPNTQNTHTKLETIIRRICKTKIAKYCNTNLILVFSGLLQKKRHKNTCIHTVPLLTTLIILLFNDSLSFVNITCLKRYTYWVQRKYLSISIFLTREIGFKNKSPCQSLQIK